MKIKYRHYYCCNGGNTTKNGFYLAFLYSWHFILHSIFFFYVTEEVEHVNGEGKFVMHYTPNFHLIMTCF